ncbi:pilus assembly protein TadG-related protein [Azospirillum sp. sgz301742]
MLRRIVRYLTGPGAGAGARLRDDESGAMMIIVALMMTLLMSLLAVGIEVGSWYMTRRNLQTAADAAAIAGALEEARGTAARVTSAATLEATRNGAVSASDVILIHSPPTSGAYAGNSQAVEAIITRPQGRLFSAVLASGTVPISARAVARVRTVGQACVLALDTSASGAITGQGSSTLNMQGCTLAANSTDSAAIKMSGSSSIAAQGLWTAGGTSLGGSSNLNFTEPPVTYAWPLADPYASLGTPQTGSCTKTTKTQTTYSPGTYCSTFPPNNGAAVLNPGVYVLDGASLSINAQQQVSCNCTHPGDGVTFVLTSHANASQIGTVSINGGASVHLNAPSGASAMYPGILIYQDRRAPSGGTNTINGGSGIVMNGAFYFPSQQVKWNGNNTTSGSSTCIEIVAKTVDFSGNSALDNSGCSALGVKPVLTTAATLGE